MFYSNYIREAALKISPEKLLLIEKPSGGWTEEHIRSFFKLQSNYPECYFDFLEARAKKRFKEWLDYKFEIRRTIYMMENLGIMLIKR